MTPPNPDTTLRRPEAMKAGLVRQVVEFLIVLSLGLLLFRTFTAEAYIVPTGSMAPTLLGMHEEVHCPNCDFRFALGVDEDGHSGRPVCPNCGQVGLEGAPAVECSGDRLLVQKLLYDYRRPRRWEVAVFHFPGDPSQAYVKRVVGLPGESIRIRGGDIYVDGQIARKTLQEQRAMRILVHDSRFVPRDARRYPRFVFRRGNPRDERPSGWHLDGNRFVRDEGEPSSGPFDIDWLVYHHWDPDRHQYGPISDFNAYNGGEFRGENRVGDVMVEARLGEAKGVGSLVLRLPSGAGSFLVSVPLDRSGTLEVWQGPTRLPLSNPLPALPEPADPARPRVLEASLMDRRLTVAVDGVLLFDPIDYDERPSSRGPDESPVRLGVRQGTLTVESLRIFRDVYYTSALANTPRRPFGVDVPYPLGRDEFFVLGDNSPVSNDSRFWTPTPVVAGELFLGKPFLVHLPGQVVPLKVFGRSFYWVPDPREIRYIR